MRSVYIWSDGGCKRLHGKTNGQQIGAGIVAVCGKHRQEWALPLGKGTSQQAELLAIYEALNLLTDRANLHVTITTDSKYCQGVLTQKWKAEKNVPIIRVCLKLMAEFGRVTIVWVKGHSKEENNIRADHLAGIACGRLKA
jgi:ribonuclease HI